MKQPFVIFLTLFLLIISCRENDQGAEFCGMGYHPNTCNVEDPINDLAWLRDEVQSRLNHQTDLSQYFFISQGVHKGQTVFIYQDCCPFCDTVVSVYNCNGELLFLGIHQPDHQVDNIRTIWHPEDFACTL